MAAGHGALRAGGSGQASRKRQARAHLDRQRAGRSQRCHQALRVQCGCSGHAWMPGGPHGLSVVTAAQRAGAGTQAPLRGSEWASQVCRSSPGDTENPSCPRPHEGSQSLAAKARVPVTPFSGLAPPHLSLWPCCPLGADIQHGGGGGLRQGPAVGAGPVPRAHPLAEKLLSVHDVVCHPSQPLDTGL